MGLEAQFSGNYGQYNSIQNSNGAYESIYAAYKRLTGQILDRQQVDCLTYTDENDKIIGFAIFVDNVGYSCKVHIYLPKQLNRRAINQILNYAFKHIGVKRLFTELDGDHIMNNILPRIGFKKIAVLGDVYGICKPRNVYVAMEEYVEKWM